MSAPLTLRRSLSPALIILYGLGTTIGAGIYVLTGKVAGLAGMFAPLSFLVASLMAACSALSFGELASRHPRSAGEAVYVKQAFGRRGLAAVVGLSVALAGCVSAAAISHGFVGYLSELVAVPAAPTLMAVGLLLGGLAAWGVLQSVGTAAVITLVEIGGLLLVVVTAREAFGELPARLPELVPTVSSGPAILGGSVLAFYAFLGFEDMVNVAEEVQDVRRTLPRAIVITLVLTALLYGLVSLAAVLAVPPGELAASDAPLALVYERSTGRQAVFLSTVGIFAVLNGALIQIIMASRVVYGLASEGSLPERLARVHPRTRTPLLATALVSGLVVALALGFPLERLAETTSFLALAVFAIVNLALVRLKRREPHPEGVTVFPRWAPWLGFFSSAGFLVYGLGQRYLA